MLQLSTKCWNSAFNAQGSRVIIVVVQIGLMKIYEERHDETKFTTKIDGFLSFTPCWMLMYFFAGFFFDSHSVYDQTLYDQTLGSGAVFVLLYG